MSWQHERTWPDVTGFEEGGGTMSQGMPTRIRRKKHVALGNTGLKKRSELAWPLPLEGLSQQVTETSAQRRWSRLDCGEWSRIDRALRTEQRRLWQQNSDISILSAGGNVSPVSPPVEGTVVMIDCLPQYLTECQVLQGFLKMFC